MVCIIKIFKLKLKYLYFYYISVKSFRLKFFSNVFNKIISYIIYNMLNFIKKTISI